MLAYQKYHISPVTQQKLQSDPPPQVKIALATGALCSSDTERLGLCVLLSTDSDPRVAKTASRTLSSWSAEKIQKALVLDFDQRVLNYIVDHLKISDQLFRVLLYCTEAGEHVFLSVAKICSSDICEEIALFEQKLRRYPDIYWSLQSNPNCSLTSLKKVESYLKQNGLFVEEQIQMSSTTQKMVISDLEAEIAASLQGNVSPTLQKQQQDFDTLDFDDLVDSAFADLELDLDGEQEKEADDSFSFNLDQEEETFNFEEEAEEEGISWEQKIKEMPVGHKIKLAYKGNKECRSILIRDTNKSVAVAVVKSGRLSDGEVAQYAANRNLIDDVIREISNNTEFVRKYAVKVALVNNPKTPVGKAISFIPTLHKRELQQLCRNKNIPSAVRKMANQRFKEKYRRA